MNFKLRIKLATGILLFQLLAFCGPVFALEFVRQKNVATYIFPIPIVDADGDFCTGATGLDTEIDPYADGTAPNGFADATNEATEIGTSGLYYILLTQSEMNNDYIAVQTKTSSAGCKTQTFAVRTTVGDPLNIATSTSGREILTAAGGHVAADFSAINGTLDAAEIGGDAITAAKIAADAFTSSELATSFVDEIVDAVWDELQSGHTTAGTFGKFLDEEISGIDDNPWDNGTRTLTALDEDDTTIDLNATTIGTVTNVSDKTGYSLSAGGVDAIWDEAMSGHTTAGSFGEAAQIIRNGTAQAGAAGSITLDGSASGSDDFYNNTIVQIVGGTGIGQSRIISDYVGATKVASVNGNWVTNPDNTSVFVIRPFGSIPGATAPTAGEVADAVWDEARADHTTNGTFGQGVASVQGNVTGSVASVSGNVGGNVTGSIGSLAAQAKADVNAEADTALSDYDAPTYTELLNLIRLSLRKDSALATDLSALITSINADLGSGGGAFANTTDSQEAIRDRGDAAWITSTLTAQNVWEYATRVLTAGTNIVLAKGSGITGFNDVSTSDLANALTAIGLDHLISASVAGTDIADNSIIAKIVSKSATADWDSFSNQTDSLEAIRDRGDAAWTTATGFSTLTAQQVWEYATRELTAIDEDNTTIDLNATTIGTVTNVSDKAGYSLSAAGVDAIWDELLSGHSTAGSAGKKLDDIPTSGVADWTAGEKTLIKQALGVNDGDIDPGGTLDDLYTEIKRTRGR